MFRFCFFIMIIMASGCAHTRPGSSGGVKCTKVISCAALLKVQAYKVRCKKLQKVCKANIKEAERKLSACHKARLEQRKKDSTACLRRLREQRKSLSCPTLKPAVAGGVVGIAVGVAASVVVLILWR